METPALPRSAAARMRRLQSAAFALTWMAYASFYLTRKNFAVVKGRLEGDLGFDIEHLGLIETLFLALYASGQFANGALGDKLGPRRVMGFGMIASAVTAWVCGLSGAVVVMGLAFGVNGYLQSTGWPNGVKTMGAWFGARSRGRVMGLWCTNYQVGGLVATALATFLLVEMGWRWAFHIPGLWLAAAGAVILVFLVERPQDAGLPPVEEDETEEEAVANDPGRAGILQMLRVPAVWALGTSYLGLKLIRYSLMFWLPYYLAKVLHYPEGEAGYLSTAFEAGGIAGAIGTGWLSDRFFPKNRARLLVPMLVVLAGALLLYREVSALGALPNGLAMALVGFLLFGPDTLISGAAAQDVGKGASTGSAAGIVNGMGSCGAAMQGVVTAYVSVHLGWEALFHVFTALSVFSAVALLPIALKRTPTREIGRFPRR